MANSFIDNFLKNLHPQEQKAVSRYLKKNISNAEGSKILQVYEQIILGQGIDYTNQAALNKLKSRIFEKSLDGLMMDEEYLSNNYSEFDQMYFLVKKQMNQCKLLNLNF
jgi:hypothetical protein